MLSLCASCNRHVKGDTCPFCGAPANEASHASARFRTAVVVIGVAAIATTACAMGGYGGPPPEMQTAAPVTDSGTD